MHRYLLDQDEVIDELSFSLSQLIDHLQKSQNCSTNGHICLSNTLAHDANTQSDSMSFHDPIVQ